MILSELCDLYDLLAADPESGISLAGYSSSGCSAAIVLSKTGEFKGIISLVDGKKPTTLIVPEQKGRTSGITPYFLCDNAKYLLGKEYDKKSKCLVSTSDRLNAAYTYHAKLAEESNDDALKAVANFLKSIVEGKDIGISDDDSVYKQGYIVFRLETGEYVHELPSVKKFWEQYSSADVSGVTGQCLITGEMNQPIARTHNTLNGIYDGNPTGCSLVGFNQSSFTSYGKTQSYNAPVSEKAMFKYTTALKYLLRNQKSKIRMGDTTVVFWAKSKGKEQDVLSFLLSGSVPGIKGLNIQAEEEILDLLKNIRAGKPINDIVDPNVATYVLGLSPNMARVSVRFWYQSTFKDIVEKTSKFYEESTVVSHKKISRFLDITHILRELVPIYKNYSNNDNIKWWDYIPSTFENNLFNSIISGMSYPMAIYSGILRRIQIEAGVEIKKEGKIINLGINEKRVGFLKAVLIRNYHNEELTVSLNQNSNDAAYNLGRLFAVMEALQAKANGTSNIRSRYFGSASVNPKLVFPSLLSLAQHHLAKLGQKGFYLDKQMESIASRIVDFPAYLSLDNQGKFVLGYYHQREFIYTKKSETENEEN